MSLREYKQKRNFRRTPEPEGNGVVAPGRVFVVQKHAARRLHYDFRLELAGTLKSWAVPKGPSLNPTVKSLAVHVEDHPLDYATFEGVIPKGEYGGGTVMVWDHGTWEPEGDPEKQYRQGKLKFRLFGQKLQGRWSLVRMGGDASEGGKNWLLMKLKDDDATKANDLLTRLPLSVVSGRDLQQIAEDADRVWSSHRRNGEQTNGHSKSVTQRKGKRTARRSPVLSPQTLGKTTGARKREFPKSMKPQLATAATDVPPGDDWLHELKFDGYRILAFVQDKKVRLVTRNGNDWTSRFPTIEAALKLLPLKSAVLDGELVCLDDDGRSNFQQLQNALKHGGDCSLVLYVFDAPFLEGYDLTKTPLLQRKQLASRILLGNSQENAGLIRYSDHIQGKGREVFEHACRYGMEGVVSKRAVSVYEQRRSPSWLKTKCLKRQEFVIGGYTRPSGSRIGFGALLLGYYEKKRLIYAGRVGTGFTNATLQSVTKELKKRHVSSAPFANPPTGAEARGATWVRPELVAEVEFTEWTGDNLLRHPSFKGLREDKPARQVVREVARPLSQLKDQAVKQPSSSSKKQGPRHSTAEPVVANVRISNGDRVLYPEMGLTKLELAEFYESISEHILPYIVNRPLTLVRCPRGRSGDCFYQKHLTDSLPDTLRGVTIQEKDKKSTYVVLDDVAGLVSLVQMGVLEMHPWGATADEPERPDQIVFDLDPGPGVAWPQVVAAAREVRDRLAKQDLECFVRTSGGKGLHVVLPIKKGPIWDDVKSFAKSIATEMAGSQPGVYVATSSKAKRSGKVFIDYLRNSRGATSVASYSTRARAGAPVATPLRWEELGSINAANKYTVANLRRRLSALKADPWQGFFKLSQAL